MAPDPVRHDSLGAVDTARLLAALVDTLLPGDAGWPSASVVGVQAVLAARLAQERGEDALDDVVDALRGDAAALLGGDEAARVAAVAAWETRDRALFGWVRDAAYMAYYESPVVVRAINADGSPYKLVAHVTGYKLPRFDLARDTPRHGRGRYIPTGAVRRVAVETLDLADERTQNWGRKQ
jgi:hypothetical protein